MNADFYVATEGYSGFKYQRYVGGYPDYVQSLYTNAGQGAFL